MKYHLTQVRIVTIKTQKTRIISKDTGKGMLIHCRWEGKATTGISMKVPQKFNLEV